VPRPRGHHCCTDIVRCFHFERKKHTILYIQLGFASQTKNRVSGARSTTHYGEGAHLLMRSCGAQRFDRIQSTSAGVDVPRTLTRSNVHACSRNPGRSPLQNRSPAPHSSNPRLPNEGWLQAASTRDLHNLSGSFVYQVRSTLTRQAPPRFCPSPAISPVRLPRTRGNGGKAVVLRSCRGLDTQPNDSSDQGPPLRSHPVTLGGENEVLVVFDR